ncbi:DUF3857 domain-containing transglutaminase family protein [bacterium]|nr:DUF3857 domain-containing transglutaminase family protein [candidate division CSSED10-310 bacterium]
MKKMIASVPVVLLCLLIGTGTIHARMLHDWPETEMREDERADFQRSIAIPYPDGSLNDAADILRIAESAGTAADYPDARAIQLFSNDRTGFDACGYYHLVQEEAVQILNQAGVDEYGVIKLNYDLPYDRTRILDAFVIQPGGRIEHVPEEAIHDVSNSEDMAANIYEPIWRSLLINFPGVQPGSIVYWAYENVSIKPRSEGAFQWGHSFQSSIPMHSASLRLLGPVGMPLHWGVANDASERVAFKQTLIGDGTILYEWCSGPVEMILSEPHMIPMQELIKAVHVSSDTWQTYSSRESKYVEPNLVPDDAIRSKVIELTEHLDQAEDKMRVLFLYVTRKVRYMGVTFGDRPGVNPDPVTRTFANNAGVCKDKAGLLTAMLRLAGIEAWYTLNNPEVRIFSDIAVDQFNHAIVSARLPGEFGWRYLDVTVDLAPTMIPSTSGGTHVLRIMPDGADIDVIPVDSPEANTCRIDVTSRLDSRGSLFSTFNYSGSGAADHYYREFLYYTDRSQWSGMLTYLVSGLSQNAEVGNWTIAPEPIDDLEKPIRITLDNSIPEYAVLVGDYLLLRFPTSKFPFDWFFESVLDVASLHKRQYPADIGVPSITISRESMTLPPGFKSIAIPDPVSIHSTWLTFSQKWAIGENEMTLEQEFVVHQPRIGVEDYAEFHDVFSRMRMAMQPYIILETHQ